MLITCFYLAPPGAGIAFFQQIHKTDQTSRKLFPLPSPNSLDVGLEELDISPGLLALLAFLALLPSRSGSILCFLLTRDPPDGIEPDHKDEELRLLFDFSISRMPFTAILLYLWTVVISGR